MIVKIYTDGACLGNPGPGGWAVVVCLQGGCEKYSGGELKTTNNRMELKAVLEALKKVLSGRDASTNFEIVSDSAYVINALSDGRVRMWRGNGWLTKQKTEVKNRDLWEQILYLLDAIEDRKQEVKFVKIKGHSGNSFNELCDRMAKKEAERVKA